MTTTQLNRQLAAGHKMALALEPQLAAVYATQLRQIARQASSRFTDLASVGATMTAAGGDGGSDEESPNWVPPDVDELLNQPLADAQAEKAATPIHLKAIEFATPPVVKALPEISFEVDSPFAKPLLEQVGTKGVNLGLAARDVILKVIGESYAQGLSVPNTAAQLQTEISHLADTTALMQARTDLNGLANGASLQSVQVLGDDAPAMKSWLATEDERTRETHADADGQEVPIDQPFQVGDDLLMYPGDPDGSDAEVINCRCTLTYGDGRPSAGDDEQLAASAAAEQEGDEMREFAASGNTGLPLSDRDRAWDAGEAIARVKAWASTDDKIDFDKYGQAFFWRDTADGDPKQGDFKLPFADVVNGKLIAVWRGITAGAARLDQTQGIDKGAVQAKMRVYYSKAAKAYDDPSIKAPFAAESGCANCGHPFADHLGSSGPCTMTDCSCNGWQAMSVRPVGVFAAAAGAPIPWRAILLVEGEPTADGRVIDVGAVDWRPPPLSLMAQTVTEDGHDGAILSGRIDAIYRMMPLADGTVPIVGEGVFDTADQGVEIARLVAEKYLTGVSVDLGNVEIQTQSPMYDVGDDEYQVNGDVDPLVHYVKGTILGATVCPFPAIGSGAIEIAEPEAVAASADVIVRVLCEGFAELVEEGLTAAAAGATLAAPPAEWFDDPLLTEPTPLSVGDDGRLVGHVACWGVCHIGNPQGPNVCTTAPRSSTGYSFIHLGELVTAEGEAISVGQITLDTDHAPLSLSAQASSRHYADTGTAAAHARFGEDRFGIWAAGAVAEDLPASRLRALRASKLSGDWRKINGRTEMIGVLAVNVPGFPIPRPAAQIRASVGEPQILSLVAAGIVGEIPPSEEQLRAKIAALAARALGRDELIRLALGDDDAMIAAGVEITIRVDDSGTSISTPGDELDQEIALQADYVRDHGYYSQTRLSGSDLNRAQLASAQNQASSLITDPDAPTSVLLRSRLVAKGLLL